MATQFINPPGEPYPVGTKVYMGYYQTQQVVTPTGRIKFEDVWVENVPVIVTQVRKTTIRGDYLKYTYVVTMLEGTVLRVAGRQLSRTKVYQREGTDETRW